MDEIGLNGRALLDKLLEYYESTALAKTIELKRLPNKCRIRKWKPHK